MVAPISLIENLRGRLGETNAKKHQKGGDHSLHTSIVFRIKA